jgi:hypothetical protein
MQMQMNARLAIRELSMHEPHVFEEYREKIIDQCQEHQIVLPPDCFYSQTHIRKMVRDSDNVSYFTSDTSVDYNLDLAAHSFVAEDFDGFEESDMTTDEASAKHITKQNQYGKCIYTGDRHASSPCKESQPKNSQQYYSTV